MRKSVITVGNDFSGSSSSASWRTGKVRMWTATKTWSTEHCNFEAVVFDYSGLLFDDRFFTLDIINEVLQYFDLTSIDLEQFQEEFALPFSTIFVEHGIAAKLASNISLKIYNDKYPAYRQLIGPFGDTLPCLKTLEKVGVKLAVVSQTPRRHLRDQLARFGIESMFASTIALHEVAREKPDPLPLLETAARLGVETQNMLYAGDMYGDVECARAAGVVSVAVDRPSGSYHTRARLLESRPDFIIPDLLGLVEIVADRRLGAIA